MIRTLALALGALALAGCPADDTGATDTDPDTDTTVDPPLVTIAGAVSELLNDGLADSTKICAAAVDPSAALEGGALNVLGTAQVGADGKFSIADVDVREAPLAIFVILDDCNTDEDLVFPTGTGIAAETYAAAVGGETFTRNSIYLTTVSAAKVDGSMAGVGSTKTLATDGAIFGVVFDSDGTTRLAGATVDCNGCENLEVYYADSDPTGGLFASEAGINAATTPLGLAVIPAGPVASYEVTATGKEFDGGLFGSIPGLAAFTGWTAN
jgi:hypothetical protein